MQILSQITVVHPLAWQLHDQKLICADKMPGDYQVTSKFKNAKGIKNLNMYIVEWNLMYLIK